MEETIQKVKQWIGHHRKVVVITGACLSGVVLMVLMINAFSSDPQELVKEFEMAVATGNLDRVESLVSPDEGLELDRKRLKQFIDHAQENSEYFSSVMWLLNAQAAHYNESEEVLNYATDGMTTQEMLDAGPYYVKRNEIPLFPDSYSIGIRPYYLKLKTNEPDAILKVDGKKVFTSKKGQMEKQYGPVMPGIYKVEAEKKFEYAHLSDAQTVDVFSLSDENPVVTVHLELVGEEVTITSEFDETDVFVNGKKVGTAGKLDSFGPLSKNGTITIHGEQRFPWGKSKSRKIKVTEDTDSVDVTPQPNDRPTRDALTQVINQYWKEYIRAYTRNNANLFTTTDDNVKKSHAEEISDNVEYERTYHGKAIGTRIDFDYARLSENDSGRYEVQLPVEFHVKEKWDSDWSFDDDEPMEEKFEEYIMTLTYAEKSKKWVVSGLEDGYYHMDTIGLFNDNVMKGNGVVKSEFK